MRARPGTSLSGDLYHLLRQSVLHGSLVAGERLHLGRIAAANQVSVGVVREAVTRLASEHLLEATPQSGFRVQPISTERLIDLTWTRTQVERLAVTESVLHGDTQWEGNVVAAHHVLSVTTLRGPDGSVTAAWMDAHRRFHAVLVNGCTHPMLLSIRQQLSDQAELYRHRSSDDADQPRDVAGEHRALVDAALARDITGVAELLVGHIETTAHVAGRALAADAAPLSTSLERKAS